MFLLVLQTADSNDTCSMVAKKPKEPYCCNGQIRSEIMNNTNVDGTCLIEYKTNIVTPNCIRKNDVIGKCERLRKEKFHCMAEDITFETNTDKNCNCINIPVTTNRICCCKNPESFVLCDRIKGIKSIVNVTYNLIEDSDGFKCEKIKIKKSIKVTFKRVEIRTKGRCNENGFRTDVIYSRYRDGCEIKESIKRSVSRRCACPPGKFTEQKCERNRKLVNITSVSRLDCCECSGKCSCEPRIIELKSQTIACPADIKRQSKCIYSNNRSRLVTEIKYILKNCKCEEKKSETFEKCPICQYKEINKTISKCCKCTGKETITTTYIDVNCESKTKIEDRECTCRDIPPSPKTMCENGLSYTQTYYYVFDRKTRTCIIKYHKIVNPIRCPQEQTQTGSCGAEKLNYSKITTIKYEVNKRTCRCEQIRKNTLKICKCPTKRITEWKCERNDHLVRSIFIYEINFIANQCNERVENVDEMKVCNNKIPDKRVDKNRCKHVIHKYFNYVKNCQCKIKEDVKTVVTCCLEPPSTIYTCENSISRVKTTTIYRVHCDKRRCEPVVSRNVQVMGCKQYFSTFRAPCVEGKYFIINTYYHVKNCKCVKRKIDKISVTIPCATKPVLNTSCHNDHWVITTNTKRIENCQCISNSKNVKQPIACPEVVRKYSSCNRETGKVTVKTISYIHQNCKCVRKKNNHQILCPCFKKDRIEKTKCIGRKRVVNKLRYMDNHGTCYWKVIVTETEDCECDGDRPVKECYNNAFFRTTTTKFELKPTQLKLLVNKCFERKSTKVIPIVCCRSSISITPCNDFQQNVISCKYKINNCKCHKVCKTKCIRACNCDRKNKSELKCENNKLNRHIYDYKDNGKHCGCECKKSVSKCVVSKSTINVPISCPQPLNPITETPCMFKENYGIYKKSTTTVAVIEDCKCQLKSKTVMKLCECSCSCITQKTCRSNRLIISTTTYKRKGNKCVPNIKETEKSINCPLSFIRVDDRNEETEYTLMYYKVVNCKCVQKQRTKKNNKCKTKIPSEKKCVNNDWVLIEYELTQKYSTYKLFKNVPKSPLVSQCIKTSKSQVTVVKCPQGSVIKCCNVKTKILTITENYFVKENCACVKKTKTKIGPCVKCDPPKEDRSDCGPSEKNGLGYRDLTVTTYKVTSRNKCKKNIKKIREICRCPNPLYRKYCENGKLVDETTVFTLTSKPPCTPIKNKKEKEIYCFNFGKPNTWKLFRTDKCKKPGSYTVDKYERDEFNGKTCQCKRVEKSVKKEICCKPCKSELKCMNNVNNTETTCWNPKGLQCISTIKHSPQNMDCPSTRKIPVGKPINCIQKYNIKSYSIINCHCVSKIKPTTGKVCCKPSQTKVKKCDGIRWRITITKFRLQNEECIPKEKIKFEEICDCDCARTFKDERIDEYTFWRSYFKKALINCKCGLRFIKKELLYYKCYLPKVTVTCENNNMVVTTTNFFTYSKFRCLAKVSRKQKPIDCSKMVLFNRISAGECKVRDTFYDIVYKNCVCERKIVKVEKNEICCYHKKPRSKTICDERIGVLTTTYFNFVLNNKMCIEQVKRKTCKKVVCKEKDCQTVVGPCVNNLNIVKLICSKRVKCKCITEVKESRQCCKPESYEWNRIGECEGCYRKIIYYAFRFDKTFNICKAVVTRVQKKLCRCCEKPTVTKSCINDILTKVISVTFTLNEQKEACTRNVNEETTCIKGCEKRRRRVRTISRTCNKATGWGIQTTEYVRANNCQCEKYQKERKYICLCQVAYPTQVKKYCKDNTLITETNTATCLKPNECKCDYFWNVRKENPMNKSKQNKSKRLRNQVVWTLTEVKVPILNCERVVTVKGNCFPTMDGHAVRMRYVSTIKYYLVNCKCTSKEVLKIKEHCECQKGFVKTECKKEQEFITTTVFNIDKGICKKSSTVVIKAVACSSKPKVSRTECINNKYTIITKIFFIQNCKCSFKRCENVCDCSCPAKTVKTKCTKAYFIDEVTTTWEMVKCCCSKNVIVKPITPICPKYEKETISKCNIKGESGYKTITTRKLRRNEAMCKCEIEEVIKYKICWCKENTKIIEVCQNDDTIITETWKNLMNQQSNKCERVKVASTSKRLSCPKNIVNRKCDKLTGIYVKNTFIHTISKCKIIITKITFTGRCKCSAEVHINKGQCPPSTCRRTDIYVTEKLKRRKCIKVQELRIFKCCCIPSMTFKQYCENHKLYNSTTKFILKDQKCNPNKKAIEIPVRCPQNIITKVGKCNNNDDKIITKYKFFNRNCKCVKEKIEEYSCKCKCPKESTTYSCNTILKVQTKTVVKNLLCQCKCVEKVKATRKTITCPEEKIVISSCKEVSGKDHGIRTTRKTKYEINNQCKCVPKDYLEEEICCCKRNEIVKSTCNKINHVMTITKSYTIFRNKQCQRNTEIVKKCVCCGSGKWSLKEESKCIPDNSYGNKVLTYVRQINDGCTCKEEVKQKKCHCICEGPPLKQLCENNRIKRIRYSYSIVKCKCVVKEEEISYKNIECNKLLPIKIPCHQDVDGVYRNSTIYRERKVEQCKCLTTERKESCVCKCKRSVTVKTCENNMFIFTKNWYKRTCKGCLTQIEKRSKPILCAPSLDCYVLKKCNGRKKDKQVYECIRKTLQNCKCVKTKEQLEEKCWCRKPKIQEGLCDKSSCTREITIITSNLIIGRQNKRKCEDVISSKKEKCCCLEKPTVTVECKNNVLKNKTVQYNFVEKCKSCSKTVNIINITPSCLPEKVVAKSTCSVKHCVQCETVTRKSLVNCQCQTSSETYCIKCRENFSVKKCKPDNNFKITCHKFTLNEGKCSEGITNEIKLTTCPETKSQYLTTCNIIKRTRILEITSYKNFNCSCVTVIVKKDEICACLQPTTIETCLKNGKKRRTTTSYILDSNEKKCLPQNFIKDTPTCCQTAKKNKECEECTHEYNKGTYKRCLIYSSVREECECIFKTKIIHQLCHCPATKDISTCSSKSKYLSYIKVPSNHTQYDMECSPNITKVYHNVSCQASTSYQETNSN